MTAAAAQVADDHALPKVMAGHVGALLETLEPGEEIRVMAMARLSNPGVLELAKGLHDPRKLVGSGARALNESPGGLIALTDRRIAYVARTLVARRKLAAGNEAFSIPLDAIRDTRAKRGIGMNGDMRKLFTLTVKGSKLSVVLDGAVVDFVEIKPLDAAEVIVSALRGAGAS